MLLSRTLAAFAAFATLLALTGCEEPAAQAEADAAWFADEAWDDGAAVVSVYRGRVLRYGHWRAAEARDYVIREHFDPEELTKRDKKTGLAVLKANRHVAFNTGTYDYRRMASLFFRRADASLVKAVGSSQDGCGLVFLRWDKNARKLSWDSYWEGEGRGGRALAKPKGEYFADELPYVARGFANGTSVTVHPPLTRSRVGAGKSIRALVKRNGAVVRLHGPDGAEWAHYRYDAAGELESWRIAGAEEFKRTVRRRLYYWQRLAPGDEKLLR